MTKARGRLIGTVQVGGLALAVATAALLVALSALPSTRLRPESAATPG